MQFLFSAAVTAASGRGRAWIRQLQVQVRRPWDFLFRGLTYLMVLIVLLVVVGIAWVLLSNSLPTIQAFGWDFLFKYEAFDPVHNTFGVKPALYGTIETSLFALIFALPLGVGTAIFLVDFCPRALRAPLAFIVDLLAAIPSIVLGLWGAVIMVPWLQKTGQPWLQKYLGFLPFFQGQFHGFSILAAGLLLIVMILPILTAITREVMLTVPKAQREGLLALGATRWEVIRYTVLPYSRVGIAGAAILALGRAIGETIAVTLVIGNQATAPSWSVFNTGYSLASVIASQFGEATPGLFQSSVLEAGLVLLVLTLIVNILGRLLISRLGHGRVTGGFAV
jgi:phosphate transport system permease protein